MEKYVKLQDVYDMLTRMYKEPRYQHDDEDYYSGVAQVAGELIGIPTILIDVPAINKLAAPVQAEWKFNEPDKYGNKKPYCSNCGEYHLGYWSDYTKCDYCPNCGANMRGGVE